MTQSFSICVFCASSRDVADEYFDLAHNLGELAADQGWRIVYGGARIGLMGRLADSAMNAGGEVIGYIPEHLKSKEIAHTGITNLHTTKTMHERQKSMTDAADAFVVLPGGLGTLAEFYEALTWKQLRLHNKPIAVINAQDYWTPMLKSIKRGVQEKFIRQNDFELFHVFEYIDELPDFFGQSDQ